LFRQLSDDFFQRERIATPDNDFLDLDWARQGSKRLLLLSHGLEGNSRRPYMLGMARAALKRGWDVLAWNFRACSDEPNRHLYSYHSGSTDDLALVTRYAASKGYSELAQVGFSIGGNKTIRYLSIHKDTLPDQLIGAVVFSVPCDLTSSSLLLARPANALYMKNFLVSLRGKLEAKQRLYPDEIDLSGFSRIRTFKEFDDRYTAPINGFRDAEDYWAKSSSAPHIPTVARPVLMISAEDDPFLTPSCFPHREVGSNALVQLEKTRFGGHVGFMTGNRAGEYWSETRALEYLQSLSRLEGAVTAGGAAFPTPAA